MSDQDKTNGRFVAGNTAATSDKREKSKLMQEYELKEKQKKLEEKEQKLKVKEKELIKLQPGEIAREGNTGKFQKGALIDKSTRLSKSKELKENDLKWRQENLKYIKGLTKKKDIKQFYDVLNKKVKSGDMRALSLFREIMLGREQVVEEKTSENTTINFTIPINFRGKKIIKNDDIIDGEIIDG